MVEKSGSDCHPRSELAGAPSPPRWHPKRPHSTRVWPSRRPGRFTPGGFSGLVMMEAAFCSGPAVCLPCERWIRNICDCCATRNICDCCAGCKSCCMGLGLCWSCCAPCLFSNLAARTNWPNSFEFLGSSSRPRRVSLGRTPCLCVFPWRATIHHPPSAVHNLDSTKYSRYATLQGCCGMPEPG